MLCVPCVRLVRAWLSRLSVPVLLGAAAGGAGGIGGRVGGTDTAGSPFVSTTESGSGWFLSSLLSDADLWPSSTSSRFPVAQRAACAVRFDMDAAGRGEGGKRRERSGR